MNRCHHAGKTEDQKGELPMMHVHAERPRHIPPHERRAMFRIEFDEQDWPLWVKVFGDDDTAAAAAGIIQEAPPEIQILAFQLIRMMEEVL